ncbi:DUF192 domain-containing protein [Trichothermofontia sp.]
MTSSPRLVSLLLGVTLLGCTTTAASDTPLARPSATPASPSSPLVSPVPAHSIFLGQMLPITAQATIAGEVIQLEVAKTAYEQAVGLMYRAELPPNHGMLFPFDPPRRVSFWMKNVHILLDMVFIKDGKVVAIAAEVPPCITLECPLYGPDQPVDQVLELRGGRAKELNLQVGDTINLQFL